MEAPSPEGTKRKEGRKINDQEEDFQGSSQKDIG
jgi:hypothetical protein